MCDPVSLGVATFAMGAVQSIAGYQQQQAQYEYQKQEFFIDDDNDDEGSDISSKF